MTRLPRPLALTPSSRPAPVASLRRGLAPVALATLVAAPAVLTALCGRPVHAQELRLGEIDFANSGAPGAQDSFRRGVLLLHSFEFEAAARAFREAQEADPDFALAYWGEAMTYNHPLWREQDGDAGRAVLARFDARGAPPPTAREAGYLEAVRMLYGEGSKAARDRAYMEAMRRLHEQHPDDLEARAFHALSILGSTDGVRDFATYARAAAVAGPVFEANPRHPGAAHYLIHSFDDPVHAPLGLPAARAYSEIAPDAGHAQHMTSHIFVALGMWDDVVEANIRARDVQDADRARQGFPPNVCGHYTSWLHYGYLMQGRPAHAERGMEACYLRMKDDPTPGERAYFASMRARHALDLEDWDAAARWNADLSGHPAARRDQSFVAAYAAARQGERGRAEAILLELEGVAGDGGGELAPRDRIQNLELRALLALDAGEGGRAVDLLREAAALEETLPFEFGPPASLKPPHELLGEVLLEVGRADEAVAAFEKSLDTTPGRTLSLMGLSIAAAAAGRAGVAADAEARLSAAWAHAEPGFLERVGR